MESQSAFFSQFIEGGIEYFERFLEIIYCFFHPPLKLVCLKKHFIEIRYLFAKRQLGCWGDDPEIQAICELYDR